MSFRLKKKAAASIPTPETDKAEFFMDTDGVLKKKNDAGVVTGIEAGSLNIDSLTQALAIGVTPRDQVPIYSETLSANRKLRIQDLIAFNPDFLAANWSDFIIDFNGSLSIVVSGTAASGQAGTYGIDGSERAKGVLQLDTGTTSTGRATACSGSGTTATSPLFCDANELCRVGFRLAPEALSTALETFTVLVGFGTLGLSAAGLPTNGVFFRYTDALNGGEWEFISRVDGATADAVDTNVVASASYSTFVIEFDSTSARGYIDGNLVATIPIANCPTGSARPYAPGAKIEKSVGTSQRNLSLDWYFFHMLRSAAR